MTVRYILQLLSSTIIGITAIVRSTSVQVITIRARFPNTVNRRSRPGRESLRVLTVLGEDSTSRAVVGEWLLWYGDGSAGSSGAGSSIRDQQTC